MSREIEPGAERPQIEQVKVAVGRHDPHSGPAGVRALTGRLRRQPAHSSRLAGSVIKHLGHNAFPCSSRVAGSRCAPHREQVSARDLATQFRHSRTPSRGLTSAMTRPQPGHGGQTIRPDPRSASASISRSTVGTGAWAPAPVSSSGRSCSAQAKRRRCPSCGAATSIAALTNCASNAGSMLVTRSMSTPVGSGSSLSGCCQHLGWCWRSRWAIARTFPQTAHAAVFGPCTPQYQSCPRRWKARISLPHSVQTGAETFTAPASRSAVNNFPITSGAGERPSVRIPGRASSPWANRRRLARPPAMPVTTSLMRARSRPGSRQATMSMTSLSGSVCTAGIRAATGATCRRE